MPPNPTSLIAPRMTAPGSRESPPPTTVMSPRTSACGPNRADPPTTTTSPSTSPLMFALPPIDDDVAAHVFIAVHRDAAADANDVFAAARARRARRFGLAVWTGIDRRRCRIGRLRRRRFARRQRSPRRSVEIRQLQHQIGIVAETLAQFAAGDRRAVDRNRRIRKLDGFDRRLEARRQHDAVRDRHDLEPRLEPRAKLVDMALRRRGDHRQHQENRRRYESSCHCESSPSDINSRCSAESDTRAHDGRQHQAGRSFSRRGRSRHRETCRRQHVQQPSTPICPNCMSHTPVPTPRVMSLEKLAATIGWLSAIASTAKRDGGDDGRPAEHRRQRIAKRLSSGRQRRAHRRRASSAQRNRATARAHRRCLNSASSSLVAQIVEWVVALHPRFSRCSASSFRAR